MNDIKNVCVYSASSTKIAKVYFDVAEELGRLLAEKKITLINGAGCIGLMAATYAAELAALHCPEVAAHWRNCLKSSPGSSWGFILIR